MHKVMLASLEMYTVQQPRANVYSPTTTTAVYSRKFSPSQEEMLHLSVSQCSCHTLPAALLVHRILWLVCLASISPITPWGTHTVVQVSLQPSEHPVRRHTFSLAHLLMNTGIPSYNLGKRCDLPFPESGYAIADHMAECHCGQGCRLTSNGPCSIFHLLRNRDTGFQRHPPTPGLQ